MKTRQQIYGQEAAGLLQNISRYPGLTGSQLSRFYPGREEQVKNLLGFLKRQGRIVENREGYFPAGQDTACADMGMRKAACVLLDLIEKVEYHSPSDFPVKICLFSNGELYEIVYVEKGQEALVSHALGRTDKDTGKRIVLVDDVSQIALLEIPGVTGYCTVDDAGAVQYYRKDIIGGT